MCRQKSYFLLYFILGGGIYMDYSYGYDPYVTSGVSAGSSIFAGLLLIIYLVSIIGSLISLIAMWKIFTKAGKPGWAVIVPIYNIVVLFEIIELEWWHVLIALLHLLASASAMHH